MGKYQCTVDDCENEAIFDMNICEPCFIEMSNTSSQNFGQAEFYICKCGTKCEPKDFLKHLETCEEE